MSKDEAREKIRKGCEARGWSPLELGQRTDVAPQVIRRFVMGQQDVRPQIVARLLRALDIDPGRWGNR